MKKTEQFIDSLLPETVALERVVLSDAVNVPTSLCDMIPIVHEDFFTSENRKNLWRTIVKFYNSGQSIDYYSIPSSVGVDIFNAEILNQKYIPTGSGAASADHAAALRNAASQRRAYFAASAFIRRAVAPGMTEQEIVAACEDFAREVAGPQPLEQERKLGDVITEIGEALQDAEVAYKEGKTFNVKTGFDRLDELFFRGFAPGQLVILAARPSVGKTAIMLQMAKAAAKAGTPTAVFSLEMTAQELGTRLLYSTGLIRPVHVATGQVEWQMFEQADADLAPLPLFINDFSKGLDEIVSRMTQMRKQGRLGIAFIDYLGLIKDCYEDGSRKLYQVIAKITGTLKSVAKRLGIPIVLLSQLNRESAKDGRAPQLYDLRDSGSIEQDADIVLMLDPEYSQMDGTRLHIYVRKHRNGPKLHLVVRPNQTYSAFTEEFAEVEEGRIVEAIPEPEPQEEDDDKERFPF